MDIIEGLRSLLSERAYSVGPGECGATFVATRKGRGLGPFFPFTDFVFVHDLDARSENGAAVTLAARHEAARAYAEERFSLPWALRYHIPVIVTVGVTAAGATDGDAAFARSSKQRTILTAGEKNSTFLIDLAHRTMIAQPLEKNPNSRYGGYNTSSINPTNRVIRMMRELTDELFSESRQNTRAKRSKTSSPAEKGPDHA